MHRRPSIRPRRHAALVVGALVSAGLAVVPATPVGAHHDANEVCAGRDTGPTSAGGGDFANPYDFTGDLSTIRTCEGHMGPGEPDVGWWGSAYRDAFRFHATVDDGVRVQFGPGHCAIQTYGEGADGDPEWSLAVGYQQEGQTVTRDYVADHDGWRRGSVRFGPFFDGGCPSEGPLTYWFSVRVIPNTRPDLTSSGGPTVVEPNGRATFEFSADDVDGNLVRVGYRQGEPFQPWRYGEQITWIDADEGQTFSQSFDFRTSENVYLFAEDAVGARDSVTIPVTVAQDDCGSGGDATILPVTVNVDCQGWLWAPTADHRDTYSFTVPPGVDRVYARFERISGFPSPWNFRADLTLRSPSGVAASSSGSAWHSVIADATESGAWALDVDRAAGDGGEYRLVLSFVGPPAPPAATATWTPDPLHQGDAGRLHLHPADPNGQQVRVVSIDWGDGQTYVPPTDTWIASGSPWSERTHRFWGDDVAPPTAVTLVNEDGETATVTVGGPDVRLHDDCALAAPGASYDAPGVLSSTTNPLVAHDAVCNGSLGHGLPTASGGVDDSDYFRVFLREPHRVEVRLDVTSGNLDARPYLYTAVGGVPVGPYLGGQEATLPVAVSTVFVRVFHLSGAGDYRLSIDARPLAGG